MCKLRHMKWYLLSILAVHAMPKFVVSAVWKFSVSTLMNMMSKNIILLARQLPINPVCYTQHCMRHIDSTSPA